MMKNSLLNSAKNIKGIAAIELTLILPFFLLLIFATTEFSRMLYQYNALNKTVRDVTRYLTNYARPGDQPIVFIEDEVAINANAIFSGGSFSNSISLLPNFSNSDSTKTNNTDGKDITFVKTNSYSLNISVDDTTEYITVTASYQWQPLFPEVVAVFMSRENLNLNFPLRATYSMRAL